MEDEGKQAGRGSNWLFNSKTHDGTVAEMQGGNFHINAAIDLSLIQRNTGSSGLRGRIM